MTSGDSDLLRYEEEGPIRIITLNDPDKRNPMTDELHEAFVDIWVRVMRDREVRAVVLTGAGKAFSAGGNGPAVGLGCSIAVSCDIVLMADTAYMADTHVNVGLVAGDGGVVTWPFMMSMLKAKEYLFTGDRITAETAVQLGLANRAVPKDD